MPICSFRIEMVVLQLLLIILGLTVPSCLTDSSSSSVDCSDKDWHSLENETSAIFECGPAFDNRCSCSRICFEGHHQYVVNCTNSNFNDTKPLESLPNKTQVLIFTGNRLEKLPWNILGNFDRIPSLRVIDMSNNKIREIRGKTYHHVQHVQRLILDFNELSLDSSGDHPRVFSSFTSLLELHLTDAFEDPRRTTDAVDDESSRRDIADILHAIFDNSHLTFLEKLHLEQNEISELNDPNVFCNLPNLLDLHLGDNALNALHFNLSCLHKLRFLDLQRNRFTKVLDRDLKTLDTIVKNNRTLTIDLSNNPFECTCKLNPFIKWMKKTKVFVRNQLYLTCNDHGQKKSFHETKNCVSKVSGSSSGHPGTTVAIVILSMILVGLICALVYIQREDLKKKLTPVIDSVNKRVRYTSIATADARENDV